MRSKSLLERKNR